MVVVVDGGGGGGGINPGHQVWNRDSFTCTVRGEYPVLYSVDHHHWQE